MWNCWKSEMCWHKMSVIKTEGRTKMTEPEYQIVAQVGKVHSVSAKMTPHCQTFAILMFL